MEPVIISSSPMLQTATWSAGHSCAIAQHDGVLRLAGAHNRAAPNPEQQSGSRAAERQRGQRGQGELAMCAAALRKLGTTLRARLGSGWPGPAGKSRPSSHSDSRIREHPKR